MHVRNFTWWWDVIEEFPEFLNGSTAVYLPEIIPRFVMPEDPNVVKPMVDHSGFFFTTQINTHLRNKLHSFIHLFLFPFSCFENPNAFARGLINYQSGPMNVLTYKTECCGWRNRGKVCPKGEACHYAHTYGELRARLVSASYKTRICRNFGTRHGCKYGRTCSFKHDEREFIMNGATYMLLPRYNNIRKIFRVPK